MSHCPRVWLDVQADVPVVLKMVDPGVETRVGRSWKFGKGQSSHKFLLSSRVRRLPGAEKQSLRGHLVRATSYTLAVLVPFAVVEANIDKSYILSETTFFLLLLVEIFIIIPLVCLSLFVNAYTLAFVGISTVNLTVV